MREAFYLVMYVNNYDFQGLEVGNEKTMPYKSKKIKIPKINIITYT